MSEISAKVLWPLRAPDSGSVGDLRMFFDGLNLLVEYEYSGSGKHWIGGIGFNEVVAFRYRNEMHGLDFASGSLDAVVEIRNSPWLAHLVDAEPKGIWGAVGKRHYAVFVSSNGYVEAIAASCEERDSREGRFPEPAD